MVHPLLPAVRARVRARVRVRRPRHDDRGEDVGQPVGGGTSGVFDRHRAAARQHQLAEPVPQPAAFARRLGLRQRIALGGGTGDLVDIGEHRLSQRHEPVRVQPAVPCRVRKPAPGDPGTNPVGTEQRVQGAAGAELAAPQPDVDLAAGGQVRRAARVCVDHGEEAHQRLLNTLADTAAEGAFQRPGVRRYLARDSRDQIIAQGYELELQDIGKIRRKLSSWNSLHRVHSTPSGHRAGVSHRPSRGRPAALGRRRPGRHRFGPSLPPAGRSG